MIALIDDLDQQQVNNKSGKPKNALAKMCHGFRRLQTAHSKRQVDKNALRQLLQLDDALLKDMGLTRQDLLLISKGRLTFDSLVKQNIMSNRDNAYSTTSLRK